MSHDELVRAFLGITDKNALAWSILDEKSEHAVSRAISLSANRLSPEGRVACVEYQRIDLAFITNRIVHSTYQAKSVYLGDYTERRIARRDPWLGRVLNQDFDKLAKANRRIGSVRCSGCIFYLYELANPSRQMKYAVDANEVSVEAAIIAMRSQVVGAFNSSHSIDCGEADGTNVKVHVVIFDLPTASGLSATPSAASPPASPPSASTRPE